MTFHSLLKATSASAEEGPVYSRCPVCSALVGQCSHLTRQGRAKVRPKLDHVQEQKYKVVPQWRGGKRRNQGER
jgi:hypothetical protein